MNEKFKKIRKELGSLNNKGISLLDLMVYDEIDCQLETKISDKDFELLFCKVINAYLKTDSVSLWAITKYCVNNLSKLEGLSSWDIVENAYI